MDTRKKKSHRQAQKEDTRKMILDSAYLLFAENGYEKTTMRALAKHAGIGLGTIFKHFPDKPSLLAAAFQDERNIIAKNPFRSLPQSGLKNQLLHITHGLYSFYASNTNLSRTLIKEVLFLEGEHGRTLDTQLTAFLADIEDLFDKAIEKGELPADTNSKDGALAFWSFYFTILLKGLKQRSFDIDQQQLIIEKMITNHFFK